MTNEDLDYAVELFVGIGNHPEFLKLVEPSVMQPLHLEAWMIKRVLTIILMYAKLSVEVRK